MEQLESQPRTCVWAGGHDTEVENLDVLAERRMRGPERGIGEEQVADNQVLDPVQADKAWPARGLVVEKLETEEGMPQSQSRLSWTAAP